MLYDWLFAAYRWIPEHRCQFVDLSHNMISLKLIQIRDFQIILIFLSPGPLWIGMWIFTSTHKYMFCRTMIKKNERIKYKKEIFEREIKVNKTNLDLCISSCPHLQLFKSNLFPNFSHYVPLFSVIFRDKLDMRFTDRCTPHRLHSDDWAQEVDHQIRCVRTNMENDV